MIDDSSFCIKQEEKGNEWDDFSIQSDDERKVPAQETVPPATITVKQEEESQEEIISVTRIKREDDWDTVINPDDIVATIKQENDYDAMMGKTSMDDHQDHNQASTHSCIVSPFIDNETFVKMEDEEDPQEHTNDTVLPTKKQKRKAKEYEVWDEKPSLITFRRRDDDDDHPPSTQSKGHRPPTQGQGTTIIFKRDLPPNEQGAPTKGQRGRIDVPILFAQGSLQQGP